jgi:hypothetical protein
MSSAVKNPIRTSLLRAWEGDDASFRRWNEIRMFFNGGFSLFFSTVAGITGILWVGSLLLKAGWDDGVVMAGITGAVLVLMILLLGVIALSDRFGGRQEGVVIVFMARRWLRRRFGTHDWVVQRAGLRELLGVRSGGGPKFEPWIQHVAWATLLAWAMDPRQQAQDSAKMLKNRLSLRSAGEGEPRKRL